MTAKKVQQAIDIYRKKLEELEICKSERTDDEPIDLNKQALEHCYGMLTKMEGFLKDGRMEKVFRWLGFLQGVLWARGIYTLDELKEHNRSDGELFSRD